MIDHRGANALGLVAVGWGAEHQFGDEWLGAVLAGLFSVDSPKSFVHLSACFVELALVSKPCSDAANYLTKLVQARHFYATDLQGLTFVAHQEEGDFLSSERFDVMVTVRNDVLACSKQLDDVSRDQGVRLLLRSVATDEGSSHDRCPFALRVFS